LIQLLAILVGLLCSDVGATDQPPEVLRKALQRELDIVEQNPEQYYLIVNLFSKIIDLKAGARILFSAPIESVSTSGNQPVVAAVFERTISPHINIPSFAGSARLADRRLPLDFVGRLIEGPRKFDRLYFRPGLMIESGQTSTPIAVTRLQVSGDDLKSLSSAMAPATPAILMQPVLSTQ
jgi:hypothetical protein